LERAEALGKDGDSIGISENGGQKTASLSRTLQVIAM